MRLRSFHRSGIFITVLVLTCQVGRADAQSQEHDKGLARVEIAIKNVMQKIESAERASRDQQGAIKEEESRNNKKKSIGNTQDTSSIYRCNITDSC